LKISAGSLSDAETIQTNGDAVIIANVAVAKINIHPLTRKTDRLCPFIACYRRWNRPPCVSANSTTVIARRTTTRTDAMAAA
jgi:hypothetical protein